MSLQVRIDKISGLKGKGSRNAKITFRGKFVYLQNSVNIIYVVFL